MYLGNRARPAALVLLAFSLAYLGSPSQAVAQKERSTLISEFLADNEEGLVDSRGERHDWIELYNPGTIPVNLRGYFLTDTPEELDRWRFPELIIRPQGYAVVFASGIEPVSSRLRRASTPASGCAPAVNTSPSSRRME